MNISVIGLGKLGLCTATCFASKGHKVIGVDNNQKILRQLRLKQCPVNETGLEELLAKSWDNLTLSDNAKDAINDSETTLIIVPTPSRPDGKFTNKYIKNVLEELALPLKDKEGFHVIGIVSTVMPGSSDNLFKPLLEKKTGKECGVDFGLVYNPEFIALGSVIRDFLNPDMVLIGASDKRSGDIVKELYISTCEGDPAIKLMTLTNAEISKLSLNCFVTMKISFVNELASICEKIPGADIDLITDALGSDTRIGKKCLRAGLGFGGPCFPRDNTALQALAQAAGSKARLGRQVVAINNAVVDRIFDTISRQVDKKERIALLGLAYKPGTEIVEESHSVKLAEKLVKAGYVVAASDPMALDNVKHLLGCNISYHSEPYSCVREAAAIVLLTNWSIYENLDWKRIGQLSKDSAVVVDCWRNLKKAEFNGFRYFALGIGLNSVA